SPVSVVVPAMSGLPAILSAAEAMPGEVVPVFGVSSTTAVTVTGSDGKLHVVGTLTCVTLGPTSTQFVPSHISAASPTFLHEYEQPPSLHVAPSSAPPADAHAQRETRGYHQRVPDRPRPLPFLHVHAGIRPSTVQVGRKRQRQPPLLGLPREHRLPEPAPADRDLLLQRRPLPHRDAH